MITWLKTIRGRTPDQALVSLAIVVFLGVTGWDLHKALLRVNSPTGVLMRLEGIEAQANATARNLAAISATVKTGTDAWQKTTTAELDFVNGALPGLTGQLQNNLDYLGVAVNQHLTPAIDKLGVSAGKLGDTADATTKVASAVSTTLTDHLDPLLDAGTGSLARFNSLMDSQDLNTALHHAYGVVGNVDMASADVAAVTAMGRKRLKPILDPDPCVGKRCFWLRTWGVSRTVLGLTGPAADLDRMVSGSPY